MVLSTIFGQSLSGMWTLVNVLQIIQYSAMMTLYYPQIVIALFRYLSITNLQSDFLETTYLYHFNESKVGDRSSWDYRFEVQKIESTNILLNSGDTFIIIFLQIFYFGLIFLLKFFLSLCRASK